MRYFIPFEVDSIILILQMMKQNPSKQLSHAKRNVGLSAPGSVLSTNKLMRELGSYHSPISNPFQSR